MSVWSNSDHAEQDRADYGESGAYFQHVEYRAQVHFSSPFLVDLRAKLNKDQKMEKEITLPQRGVLSCVAASIFEK
ncbi:hypothetical protein [Roseixanthobacter glucoisosaccharinicivorans]|uniref:hypothetical protein n=1 Tax=Roseixanthobacter glucoisosaccharinicivorans TaxID=3119923 RepID=UPI00372B8929